MPKYRVITQDVGLLLCVKDLGQREGSFMPEGARRPPVATAALSV
jgi:hypothetical protein